MCSIINFIRNTLTKTVNKIKKFLNPVKNLIKSIKFKYYLIASKVLCFSLLTYSALLVTFDYFKYPYIYNLKVIQNINGFNLPDISFCTDSTVLFDRSQMFQKNFNPGQNLQDFIKNKSSSDYRYTYEAELYYIEQKPIDFDLEPYFNEIQYNITKTLNFTEMKKLMVRANQLFNCSAKVHFRYESIDSNAEQIQNCFEKFEVLESIYGNKDFGICYKFSFNSMGVYLKDDDYIEFVLSFGNKPNFIKSLYFKIDKYITCFYDKSFDLFLIIHQKTNKFKPNKFNSIRASRQGLDGELKMTKTSVKLLPTPHMQECTDQAHQGDCYQNCVLSECMKRYECLPNPFVYENFILINSSQTEHRICNRDIDFNSELNNCDKICIKNCEEVYYLTLFENPMIINTTETKITIRDQKSEEFQYISEIKYTFVDSN